MNYIVFDLEWNQSPGGKKYSNSRLPFEIIEIGAVKMNEQREVVDVFQRLVKPQVYNWIHDSIHEVIHVDYKDRQTQQHQKYQIDQDKSCPAIFSCHIWKLPYVSKPYGTSCGNQNKTKS